MSSIGAAEWKLGVKMIREWIQNESKIQNKVSSKNRGSFAKKLDGGGFRGNAFGVDNSTKIRELTSVTEIYSKESQDICRGKSCC